MIRFKTVFLAVAAIVILLLLLFRIIYVIDAESHSISLDRELAKEKGFLSAEYIPVKSKLILDDSIEFAPGSIWVHEPIKFKHRFFIFNSYYAKLPDGKPELIYTAGSSANGFILTTTSNDTNLSEQFFGKDELTELKTYTLADELVDKNGIHFTSTDYTKVDTIKLYIKKANFIPSQPLGSAAQSDYILYNVKLEKEPVDSLLFVKSR